MTLSNRAAAFLVSCLAILPLTITRSSEFPLLDIKLAHEDQEEKDTQRQLERLLRSYNPERFVWTRRIIIESGFRVVPHSHPTLTLSTKRAKDDELLLSTFLHEQLHWYLEKKPEATAEAVAELRIIFPKLPVGFPEGANTEESSYEHILVCYLEYKVDQEVFGALKAHEIIGFWRSDHYTKIYSIACDDGDRIEEICRKHRLLPISD